MAKVMLIGAGGVAGVAAAKMAQNPDVFGELLIASRTKARCDAIKADIERRRAAGTGKWATGNGERGTAITTAQIDAMDVAATTAMITDYKPDLVMNIALPYQDLAIMDACLAAGVSYLDTANYEPPDDAHFEYSWQWAYREKFEKAGLTAILGCGFDPTHSTSSTATAAIMAIRSPPTSTRRSTSVRCPRRDRIGSPIQRKTNPRLQWRTARRSTRGIGLRPRRWRSSACTTSIRWARRICTFSIMRNWNRSAAT